MIRYTPDLKQDCSTSLTLPQAICCISSNIMPLHKLRCGTDYAPQLGPRQVWSEKSPELGFEPPPVGYSHHSSTECSLIVNLKQTLLDIASSVQWKYGF